MTIEKRYQVFVSSTYEDLIEERAQIYQAILDSNCIPVGMESFPPSNQTQLKYTMKAIDQCDYYILMIAGRYGSVDPVSGLSFTEQEYLYAEPKKPILVLVHSAPDKLPPDKRDLDSERQKKLKEFRERVLDRALPRPFSSPIDVFRWVLLGLTELRKEYPDGGWIPAKSLPPADIQQKLESLGNENEALRAQLVEARSGKGCVHSIDIKQNHMAAKPVISSYIRESLSNSDDIIIKVIAVSMYYTWDFLRKEIPQIFSDIPDYKRITLEMEMVEPDYLGRYHLSVWKDRASHVEQMIAEFIEADKKKGHLIESGKLKLFVYQYNNIPHWHGTLVNNQYLALGRTKPIVHHNIADISVSDEVYRIFSSNDAYGGQDRIALFNSWFDFYALNGIKKFSEARKE